MARDFSGTNQFLDRAGAVVTAAPLTLACWFNSDTNNAFKGLVGLNDGTANESFGLGLSNAGPVLLTIFAGGNNSQVVTTASISTGVWNHGCAVFASTTSRAVYLNGGNKATNTNNRSPTGVNSTDVGQDGAGAFDYDGRMAEVAIWNAALGDDEVALLALGYSPLLIRPQSLVAYYPLLGNTSPEIDLRGGNGLTVTGATKADHCRVLSAAPRIIEYKATPAAAGQPTMRRWGGVPGMVGAGRIGRSW